MPSGISGTSRIWCCSIPGRCQTGTQVHYRLTARNRVWLARRRLPAVRVPAYLGVWIAITLARTHSAAALRTWATGCWEGIRTPCGPRQPMQWRTVWRMTRLGRPPVI
jgi:hypothetical protein